jgi:uncharacterized protein (TIGR02145 family)
MPYKSRGKKINNMNRKFFKISILIASVAIIFSSCSKTDDDDGNITNGKTTAVFNSNVTYGSMTDQDGNVYKTVTIGTQTWMAENLRTTKYNDGTEIPNVTDIGEWSGLTSGAYCNYNNATNIDTIATYGRLYNWYAVNTGELAPNGWHVPTDDEWTTLTTYLGGDASASDKIKETGTLHWEGSNSTATNESGFTAIPGGHRYKDGLFKTIGQLSLWWSSTEYDLYAWGRHVSNLSTVLGKPLADKEDGFSIRCVKD